MPPRRPVGYYRTRLTERDAGYVTLCHEWTGARHKQGYGTIVIDGKTWLVHRLAWTEAFGDPGGFLVCHHCDNPPCARLDHLHLGTYSTNNRDAIARGLNRPPTSRAPQPGSSNPNHKLTEPDVRFIRASDASPSSLAVQFGVTRRTIHDIRTQRTWRHI